MHRKSSVMDSPLIKLQGCNFIKKRLQRRCFPVNIAKFLKTTFLLNTSGDYFWKLDLKTFFCRDESILCKKNNKTDTLKIDVHLFVRVSSVSKERDVDVQNILCRDICTFLLGLFYPHGAMRHTAKSNLLNKIENER